MIKYGGNRYTALELAKVLAYEFGARAIVDLYNQIDEGITEKECKNLEKTLTQQNARVRKMLKISTIYEKVRSRNGGKELDGKVED